MWLADCTCTICYICKTQKLEVHLVEGERDQKKKKRRENQDNCNDVQTLICNTGALL